MLKHKKDKQPVPKGHKMPAKAGNKKAKEGTANLAKGKYAS